jgi:hypothetical protein
MVWGGEEAQKVVHVYGGQDLHGREEEAFDLGDEQSCRADSKK